MHCFTSEKWVTSSLKAKLRTNAPTGSKGNQLATLGHGPAITYMGVQGMCIQPWLSQP